MAVFETIQITPTLLHHDIPSRIPEKLKRRYPWGFSKTSQLSYGYILPKGKKAFTTARPIIASRNTICCHLFRALALVLTQIMEVVYKGTFGNRKMLQILAELKLFMKECRDRVFQKILMDNADLKGFFTSVPHGKLTTAVQHLVHTYHGMDKSRREFKTIAFAVKQRFTSKTRIIRGRSFTKSTKNHVIFLEDICSISQLALTLSHFTCMGKVHMQSRGAIMGGHASPILCAVAVAYDEWIWKKAYNIQLHPSFLCIRYVDNRLTILEENLNQIPAYSRFLNKLFYKFPVELEDCGNNKFLGYCLDFHKGHIWFDVPTEKHAYRSIRSAGTTDKVLSGLTARLHLLHRGTHPKELAKPLISQLLENYEQHGFPKNILTRIAFKVGIQYRNKTN